MGATKGEWSSQHCALSGIHGAHGISRGEMTAAGASLEKMCAVKKLWAFALLSSRPMTRPHFICLLLGLFLMSCDTATSGTQCSRTSECGPGLECRLGFCRALAVPKDGGATADSGVGGDPGRVADAGTVLKACAATGTCLLGDACTANIQCKNQFCADGVCCGEPCGGGCGVCNVVGSEGVCLAKVKGAACGSNACDGASKSCPTGCSATKDCSAAFACCLKDDPRFTACNANGLGGKCTKLSTCMSLVDDFSSPSGLNERLWTAFIPREGQAFVQNGKLVLAAGRQDSDREAFASLTSADHISLVESTCTVELGDLSALRNSAEASGVTITIEEDSLTAGNSVGSFSIINGELSARELTADGGVFPKGIPFDPVQHKFLRIGESNGVVSFEHSADGKTFKRLTELKTRLRVSDLRFGVSTFRSDGGTQPPFPQVFFESINKMPQ